MARNLQTRSEMNRSSSALATVILPGFLLGGLAFFLLRRRDARRRLAVSESAQGGSEGLEESASNLRDGPLPRSRPIVPQTALEQGLPVTRISGDVDEASYESFPASDAPSWAAPPPPASAQSEKKRKRSGNE